MKHYKLSDIVIEINERENDPSSSKYDRFVGLEHYVSGDVIIRNYGSTELLGSSMKVFRAGDVLVARRNVYLKRAATVDFDGLTSGDSIVLRAKSELFGKILPFILNTDEFWDYADKYSDGTMSKRLSPKVLMQYEFDLPDDDKLAQLVDILWASNDAKESYRKLLHATDDLVKSQFIEMFGSPVLLDKGWETKTIAEVASTQLGKMYNEKRQTGKEAYLYLANRNLQWFQFDFSDLRKMDFDPVDRKKYELRDGDLLVCEGGEIGRCAVWHEEISDCYMQNAIHRVRCNQKLILPDFLGYVLYYHAQENGFSDIVGGKATIAHLPADKLRTMKIPVPPIDTQSSFVSLVKQSDKSKYLDHIQTYALVKGGKCCA